MAKEFVKKEFVPHFDDDKSSALCYEAVYGESGVKNKGRISSNYRPFINYLRLAQKAANLKRSIEAQYDVIDRNNDYRLSTWLTIKVLTKKLNGNPIVYNDITYETLENSGVTLEPIEVTKITVDGKEMPFHKIDDFFVVEGVTTSKIVVNDDPTLALNNDVYCPQHVLYNGNIYEVRKNKASINETNGDICEDAQFPFIKFHLEKDDNDQKEDEVTLELIEDPSLELSIYDVFFGEDAAEVYFTDYKVDKCRIVYKNKESGRLVIKLNDKVKSVQPHGVVHLATNTVQLSRQRNAIETIVTRPSESQKTLLDLCDLYRFKPQLAPFNFRQKALDYVVLTDSTRDGTMSQRTFVQKAMQTPDFMILQGPPGSGKTTAILELIYQLIKEGKKVLLCASTHVAIDNVLEKIITHKDSDKLLSMINPVRVGDESNVYSECVKPFIYLNIMKNVPEDYQDIVTDSFNLVCGTTIGVLSFPPIFNKVEDAKGTSIEALFDYMILDEASKTTFSEFLVPAVLSKRWIIVGDVKQLAPYVEKNDLVPSLLECEPLSNREDRIALNLLRLLKNEKKRATLKNHAYILPTSSITYLDKRLGKDENIIAVTNEALENLFAISTDDFNKNTLVLSSLSAYNNVLLIDSELIDEVIPYLNKDITVLDFDNNISRSNMFEKYQVLRFRGNFKDGYSKEYNDYSRKLEDELLWRLIRLYELKSDQGSSVKYKKFIDETRALLSEEDKKKFDETVDLLSNIAIPSIIMMLQEGIKKGSEFQNRLTAGLTEEEKVNRFVRLEYQHRMHPDISKVSRENIYNGEALKDCSLWQSKIDYINSKSRFELRHVESPIVDNHNRNENEASAILEELKSFIEHAKKHPKADGSKYEIAILTFYNTQVAYMRKLLQSYFNTGNKFNFTMDNVHVALNTVDKFQGQEADIVYLSMVQNNRVGFLDSISRVNVAITRAKEKIIIFGDKEFFQKQDHSELLNKLFKEAK